MEMRKERIMTFISRVNNVAELDPALYGEENEARVKDAESFHR